MKGFYKPQDVSDTQELGSISSASSRRVGKAVNTG